MKSVVVEFYKPGSSVASARWDFPAGYEGSGADDDMWLDKAYLRQLIAKSARPTLDCAYRITLSVKTRAPEVAGFSDTTFLSTGTLAARAGRHRYCDPPYDGDCRLLEVTTCSRLQKPLRNSARDWN